MKRPIVLFGVFLCSGIIIANISSSLTFILCLIALFALASGFFCIRFTSARMIFCGIFIFFAIGSLEFTIMDNYNNKALTGYDGTFAAVEGFISSEPDIRDGKIIYVLKTTEINDGYQTRKINARILLSVYTGEKSRIFAYGRKIKAEGQINLPKGKRNPGGFDSRAHLAKSGVSATIYCTPQNVAENEYTDNNLLMRVSFKLRTRILTVIDESLPVQQAGLLKGMLIGYTAGLDKDIQKEFSDAGLSHIMAVSGANIAFIVLPLLFVFKKARIKQYTANTFILIVLFIFTLIVGFSPSVLRAVIMASVVLIAQIIRRETDFYTSIVFSGILILLYNPYSLFDIGFMLSYGATLSIVLFFGYFDNKLKSIGIPVYISNVLSVSIAAQIGVIPITAYYFNKISIISLASNLLVVPLTGIITVLGLLMAILGQAALWIAEVIGYVNCSLLSVVLIVTHLSAGLPFSVIQIPTPGLMTIFGYYTCILFFFWYRPHHPIHIGRKYFAAFGILAAIFLFVGSAVPKEMEVVFLDVGEGDAAFIRTSTGKTVLIDGGGKSGRLNSSSNLGEMVVLPFLLDYGVTRLDTVIATHGHDDHIAGLMPVLQGIKVGNLIIPGVDIQESLSKLKNEAVNRHIAVTACNTGDRILLDKKTYFDVLLPEKESDRVNSVKTSLNDTSLVLKLHYNRTRILFTGDMEDEVEKQLLEDKTDINADILKVAHHGSAYSTGEDFLKAVKPSAAVISVGKNNFGHPSVEVMDRIKSEKIRLFRTDLDGAIIIKSNGTRIKIAKTVFE